MSEDIKCYLDSLEEWGEITQQEKQFFLGWCKEGGDEFIKILEQMLEKASLKGYLDYEN